MPIPVAFAASRWWLTVRWWQLGLVALLSYALDPFSILVAFLVFAIGVSHGVQKMNGIVQDVGRGPHHFLAALHLSHLFLAGLTVLLADMLGFAVLMLIDTPMIQNLAITASIGVDTQGATDPATCRAPSDRNLQECAGVYRQGGCLDCHHAGCRHGHLGAIKFQVGMGIQLTFMVIWNMIGALLLIPALSHFLLKKAP